MAISRSRSAILFGGSLAASAALLSVHKIGNQATQSRIAWLPEEHNLMGIVVFGEMPSRSFYGFFDMKLPKTCSRRKEHSMPLHMSNQSMKPARWPSRCADFDFSRRLELPIPIPQTQSAFRRRAQRSVDRRRYAR
jgi:hypothetical protein